MKTMIIIKTKAFLPICLLTLLLFQVSCSDFLEVEPQNEITLENFWNEKSDVNNIVTGCYSALQSKNVISRMMVWGESRSENIVEGQNIERDVNLQKVLKENIDASNSYTTWNDFYTIINRCNIVMKYAPSVAQKDLAYTDGDLRATIAEVTALRSLCYFYLIRTFRDVPYSTTAFTDDDQVMDLPATPFEAVLDSCIASLEAVQGDAMRYYPTTKPLYQTGRITQAAIHAMLADMYLWKKDYANCVKYCDLVIDIKRQDALSNGLQSNEELFNGFPLYTSYNSDGSFGNAYNKIFVEGNSAESIFEITFTGDENMPSNLSTNDFYGVGTAYPGLMFPSDFIALDVRDAMFNVFRNSLDGRSYESLRPLTGGTMYGINKYVNASNARFQVNGTAVSGDWGGMYASVEQNKSNWIIYRLTDVMLMKAEALTQMMGDGENITDTDRQLAQQAFTLVNAVNKRSIYQQNPTDTLRFADYSTKNVLTDLVYDERERELMFEGKRWYDLVRRSQREGNTNYLLQKVVLKGSGNSSVVQSTLARMNAIYWPYNIEELKVNHNLTQNPAFGGGVSSNYDKTAGQ